MLLGIHGGKLCLACVKVGDEIRLQLEVSTCLVTATPTRACMCSFCGLSGVHWAILFHVGWLGLSCRCIQQGAQLLASNRDYSQITHLLNVCLYHTAHVPLAKVCHVAESASVGEGTT